MDGYGRRDNSGLAFAYRFGQRLFSEPDDTFWRFLSDSETPLRDVGVEIDKGLTYECLREEYTRLFLGPRGHLPPYESAFVEGRLWGTSAAWVRDFVAAVGLKITPDFRMPPDHVAVEMEVLELLLTSDHPQAQALYARFFHHRMPWLKEYIPAAEAKTALVFYRTSFTFLASFLGTEEERLRREATRAATPAGGGGTEPADQ